MTVDQSSLWKMNQKPKQYPALEQELSVDTLIIGAGITGLSLAQRLVSEGQEVCVLERHQVSAGTTGFTSAHLSNSWDPGYPEVIKKHDLETAQTVHTAMTEAIDYIGKQSQQMVGGADFRYVDAYYYRENEKQEDVIRDEAEALEKMGAEYSKLSEAPLPFSTLETLKIPRQAVFQPVQYLQGLIQNMSGPKFSLYEKSPVIKISGLEAITPKGRVRAKHIVHATHTPLGISPVQAAMVPTRSFVIAAKAEVELPDALFWDTAEPYHYIRKYSQGGEEYLVIGGGDRQTGDQHEAEGLEELKAYARSHFGISEISHQWSAQFYEPSDHLPIIGRSLAGGESYITTGFSGDGLTFGTVSALLISDLILGRANKWEEVFSPTRFSYLSKEAVKHNLAVGKHVVVDRIKGDGHSADELEPGAGCVVPSLTGPKAYHRAETGEVYEMSAVCPHMGCVVKWNDLQKSFDCPCHGSRFGNNGEVLEGPAYSGLSDRKLLEDQKPKDGPHISPQ